MCANLCPLCLHHLRLVAVLSSSSLCRLAFAVVSFCALLGSPAGSALIAFATFTRIRLTLTTYDTDATESYVGACACACTGCAEGKCVGGGGMGLLSCGRPVLVLGGGLTYGPMGTHTTSLKQVPLRPRLGSDHRVMDRGLLLSHHCVHQPQALVRRPWHRSAGRLASAGHSVGS